MLRFVATIIFLAVPLLACESAWSDEPANAVDRLMERTVISPQNLIPNVFALGENATEVQRQLFADGYRLDSTRVIAILLERHVPAYNDGDMFDFDALGSSGPTAQGKELLFGKSGPGFCDRAYEVRLGITDDGKLQYAEAQSRPVCVL